MLALKLATAPLTTRSQSVMYSSETAAEPTSLHWRLEHRSLGAHLSGAGPTKAGKAAAKAT